MLDVHLRLFSERLKRVLAGEEGTLPLPDSANLTLLFQNLLAESEIITTTLLGNYEADMARILFQLIGEQYLDIEISLPYLQLLGVEESDEDVKRSDILEILEDINNFVRESEEAIDTFFILLRRNKEISFCTLCNNCKSAFLFMIHNCSQASQLNCNSAAFSGSCFEVDLRIDKSENARIALKSGSGLGIMIPAPLPSLDIQLYYNETLALRNLRCSVFKRHLGLTFFHSHTLA